LCSSCGGSENRLARFAKAIHDTCDQGSLWADNGEIDTEVLR